MRTSSYLPSFATEYSPVDIHCVRVYIRIPLLRPQHLPASQDLEPEESVSSEIQNRCLEEAEVLAQEEVQETIIL